MMKGNFNNLLKLTDIFHIFLLPSMLDRIMQNIITVTNIPVSNQPSTLKPSNNYSRESTKEYIPEFLVYFPWYVGKTMGGWAWRRRRGPCLPCKWQYGRPKALRKCLTFRTARMWRLGITELKVLTMFTSCNTRVNMPDVWSSNQEYITIICTAGKSTASEDFGVSRQVGRLTLIKWLSLKELHWLLVALWELDVCIILWSKFSMAFPPNLNSILEIARVWKSI